MTMMQFSVGSITMFMLMSVVYTNEDPGYACYPNGTITIDNPDVSVYTNVMATYDDGVDVQMCTVNGLDVAVITDCDLQYEITVVFSTRPSGSDIITIGKDDKACRLKCNQIVQHVIDFNRTFGITLPVTVKPTVAPQYGIYAGFYDPSNPNSPVNMAQIGHTIDFTMVGPVEYYLRPIECTAYNGLTKESSTSKKTLIKDGCTTDDNLISDFIRSETGAYFQYMVTMSVFRFYQSNDIYVECTVQVCPQPDDCRISCSDSDRRRRQVIDPFEGLSGHDSRLATIGRSLHIQDDVMAVASLIHGTIRWSVLLFAVMVIHILGYL